MSTVQQKNYCVYVLADPDTKKVFYVGETRNAERRKEQHFEGSDQLSGYKVKLLKAAGKEPIFQIIEHCENEEEAMISEIHWIYHFIKKGHPLLNSQNFNGAAGRQMAKREMGDLLNDVTNGKYAGDQLRHVANGRTFYRGKETAKYPAVLPAGSTPTPAPQPREKKHEFSHWETEVMRKNLAKNVPPYEIAKIIGRTPKEVKEEIRRLS